MNMDFGTYKTMDPHEPTVMWPKYHQHMTPCDQELHLIRETSPSVKRTQNDGSSKDDIIPYHHQRSAVHFSSPHDQKCCTLLILLIEVLYTSSYHSLSAYRIRSCCWINRYPLSLMDISDTAHPQPSYWSDDSDAAHQEVFPSNGITPSLQDNVITIQHDAMHSKPMCSHHR